VLCSAWSESEVQALRGPGGEAGRAYAAASSALAGAVRQRLGPAVTVECVPPGVYATQDELKNPPLQRASESLCCVVVGNGCYDGFYRALLEGIGRSRQRLPGAMYFFYTTGADQHQIWQAAERMELLEQVSLVPAGTDARQLMTQADVLLQPQPLHAVHTVVLEAMAAGRPVIAAADPLVDHLIEGRTARLMAEPDALQWAGHLTCLAQAPQQYMALGRSARQYILDHHRASAFAGSLHRLYERLAAPAVIPFR
jgi:glycosyltransferase involved in cell wall biosynthesis